MELNTKAHCLYVDFLELTSIFGVLRMNLGKNSDGIRRCY